MRPQPISPAHAGSTPLLLRGKGSLRTVFATAVAAAIGLTPAIMIASPAAAAANTSYTVAGTPDPVAESGTVTFTITRTLIDSGLTGQAGETLNYTLGGTATAADYTGTSPGTVVFTNGQTTGTVVIPIVDDTLDEVDETLSLTVTGNPGPGTLTDEVTITDNDVPPTFTLNATPTEVTEGVGAKTTINATLATASSLPVTINLTTADVTTETGDYTPLVSSPLVIAAGRTTALTGVDVLVTDDGVRDDQDPETFTVTATTSTNGTLAGGPVPVSIEDAQTDPVITLTGGGPVAEGAAVEYTVGITPQSDEDVTVTWDSAAVTPTSGHGTAAAGADFEYPTSRVVTVEAGTSSETFTIDALADDLVELPEDFAVQLSNPSNATLGTSVKVTSTITDESDGPTVSILPTDVMEGNTGQNTRTFVATLSQPSAFEVKVSWATALSEMAPGLGYAAAVKDFVAKSGTLTFPANTTTQTFTVDIVGDTVDEGAGETFVIRLSNVNGSATIGDNANTEIEITDDDSPPTIAFGDVTVKEGESGSAVLMPLTLNGSSDRPLVFDVATSVSPGTASASGTAVGQNDYDLLTDTVTIPAESTSPGYVVALVNGDYIYEADETANFTVTADNAALVTDPDTLTAQLTIENDDVAPDLEINSVTGAEDSTVAVTGRVTGISATDTTVTVLFAGGSSMGSAAASSTDFVNPGATPVVIPAGTTPGTDIAVANVPLVEDELAEPAETIIATGFGLGNVGTVTEGIITIAASDGGVDPTDPTDPTNPNDPEGITVVGPYRTVKGPFELTGLTDPYTNLQLFSAPYTGDDDSWVALGTTQSSSTGTFSFTPSLTTTGRRFEVRAGDTVSNEAAIRLQQVITLTGTSSGRGIAALRVAGGVPRMPFILQRSRGTTYITLFTGNLQSTGTYYKALPGQPSGQTFRYRAYVYGNSFTGIDAAYSPPRSVRIR